METPSTNSSVVCEIPDLTTPDDFSDVILIVEGRKLYTCRGILGSVSPVWRRMFISGFREKEAKEIPLPGKLFHDVLELLYCVSPAIQKPVAAENVDKLVPLADEYQMQKLKSDCETWLLHQLASQEHTVQVEPVKADEADQEVYRKQQLRYLGMAQRYNLPGLLDRSVDMVSSMSAKDLHEHPDFDTIEQDTLVKILTHRVYALEKNQAKLTQSVDHWRGKCEDAQDCLMRLGREKLTIKRSLDEAEAAWEVKSSDCRCIDPVHIYGPRNYNCEKCTRQVHTYIQSKIWYLLNRGVTCSGITWPQ